MTVNQAGDTVRLRTLFQVGGVDTDPDTVTLTVTAPDGTSDDYTGVALTNPATGVYQRDIQVDDAGRWTWRWRGTGAAAGVDEGSFTVRPALADTPMLTTVDAVNLEVESSNTEDDDLIERLIVAASAAVIRYTERQFTPVGATETTRTFDLAGTDLTIDPLAEPPSAVAVYDASGVAWATIDPDEDLGYLPYNRPWSEPITILRLRSAFIGAPTGSTIAITGRWGYPVVPPDVEHAVIIIVREWLSKSDSEWNLPSNIDTGIDTTATPSRFRFPSAAKQILDSYRRLPIAVV